MTAIGKLVNLLLVTHGARPTPACVCGHPRAAHREGSGYCAARDSAGVRCACTHYVPAPRL